MVSPDPSSPPACPSLRLDSAILAFSLRPARSARLLCLGFLLLLTAPLARAKLILYYRMDSLGFLADAVVLCEEQSVSTRSVQHHGWREKVIRVRCRVVETFKGELPPGAEFEVEYDPVYVRVLPGDEGRTYLDAKGKVLRTVKPKTLLLGRALLFLRREAGVTLPRSVVSAKLIQGDQVYQYGQFRSNPGGLVLAPQGPENLRLAPAQKREQGPRKSLSQAKAHGNELMNTETTPTLRRGSA